ncbi:MAG: hypothetical protein QM796_05535 [Chthoniobacteraceae bacterium]
MRSQFLMAMMVGLLMTASAMADTIVVYQGAGTQSQDSGISGVRSNYPNHAYLVLDLDSKQMEFIVYAAAGTTKQYYTYEATTTRFTITKSTGAVVANYLANNNVGENTSSIYSDIVRITGTVGKVKLTNGTSLSALTTANYERTISDTDSSQLFYFVYKYILPPNLALTQKVTGGTYDDAKAAVLKKLTDAGYVAGP